MRPSAGGGPPHGRRGRGLKSPGKILRARAPSQRRPRGDVRAQVLKVATHLLATRGFDGTTIQMVAEEVGIRKPSVLHHFPSKEALHGAVIDQMVQHWNVLVPRIVQEAGSGNLEALTRGFVNSFTDEADWARLLLRESLDRPREFRHLYLNHVRPWLEMVVDGVKAGQQRGVYLPDVDPDFYVLHVVRLIILTMAKTEPSEPRAQLQRSIREVLRMARSSLLIAGEAKGAARRPAAPKGRDSTRAF